jgi:spore germination cell wall hydrolase CwlJ-like protein
MRKLIAVVLVLCAIACVPSVSFTEDAATVRLARVLYALAGDDTYEAKLAIGTVIMNRVASPWFPDTLEEVLQGQQQFPCGKKYDAESLKVAHEILAGKRTLPADALYYQAKDATTRWTINPCAEAGSYNFYAESD